MYCLLRRQLRRHLFRDERFDHVALLDVAVVRDGDAALGERVRRSGARRSVVISSYSYGLSGIGRPRCGVTGSSWFQTSGGARCGIRFSDKEPLTGVAMHESWETVVTGPPDAARSALMASPGLIRVTASLQLAEMCRE